MSDTRKLSNTARSVIEQAADAADSAGGRIRDLAHHADRTARRRLRAVSGRAAHTGRSAIHHIQEHPLQSMAIVAAVGAVAVGLLTLFGRRDD